MEEERSHLSANAVVMAETAQARTFTPSVAVYTPGDRARDVSNIREVVSVLLLGENAASPAATEVCKRHDRKTRAVATGEISAREKEPAMIFLQIVFLDSSPSAVAFRICLVKRNTKKGN